ncbi:hypothetical protein HYT25_02375 [Candidatus Pacearchaeota archaeon]|nr:hypothetical protein [Candidatus Pacearchaeota archaeon]
MKNKSGLSGIVVTLILIALTVVSVVIVWTFINNLITEKVKSSESCFGNFGKITLDEKYICFDDTTNKVHFAISIGDIDVEGVLVSISTQAETTPFTLTNEEQLINGLEYFNGTDLARLPPKNSGRTYFYDSSTRPNTIQIAPIISGVQCEVSDVVSDIDDCSLLA